MVAGGVGGGGAGTPRRVSKLGVVVRLTVWGAGIALVVWLVMRGGTSPQPEPPAGFGKESDAASETRKQGIEKETAADVLENQRAVGRARQKRALSAAKRAEDALAEWEAGIAAYEKELASSQAVPTTRALATRFRSVRNRKLAGRDRGGRAALGPQTLYGAGRSRPQEPGVRRRPRCLAHG